MINVTQVAEKKLKEMLQRKETDGNAMVRIFVSGFG